VLRAHADLKLEMQKLQSLNKLLQKRLDLKTQSLEHAESRLKEYQDAVGKHQYESD
jgi:hypothetical protein